MLHHSSATLALALLPGSGGISPPEDDWTFKEVAPACGIDFRAPSTVSAFRCILEDTGSGVALLDYDGDGLCDVYFACGTGDGRGRTEDVPEEDPGSRNRLYHNLGGWRFEDVTDAAGVGDTGYGMGIAVGDYDGDGDEDLFVLNYGPNVLYRNDGNGHFTDVTEAAGLRGPPLLGGCLEWSVSGVFFDADQDGDLDLLVANYLAYDPESLARPSPGEPYAGPEAFAPQRSILYRNEAGHFLDITADVGLEGTDTKSMGVSVADFDDDGFPDVFEAGDTMPNAVFRGVGRSRWSEYGYSSGAALDRAGRTMSSMHGTVGDYDGDGRLDLFVPNLDRGCLYRNLGGFQFQESGSRTGIDRALRGLAGWGSRFGDFDLDGDLDLLVVTGGTFAPGDTQPLKLLRNDGAAGFADVSADLGPDFGPCNGRGAAFGDLDLDGDLDVVIHGKDAGGRVRVLRNDLPVGRHWLLLELEGTKSPRDAVGARVELRVGGRWLVREVQRSNSYLSQDDRRVHFGLGACDQVEELRIRWPSGAVQRVTVDGVDRVLPVREPPE